MNGMMGVISYGLGTILGLVIVGTLVFWFVQDITQKKHTVLRNFPVRPMICASQDRSFSSTIRIRCSKRTVCRPHR